MFEYNCMMKYYRGRITFTTSCNIIFMAVLELHDVGVLQSLMLHKLILWQYLNRLQVQKVQLQAPLHQLQNRQYLKKEIDIVRAEAWILISIALQPKKKTYSKMI